MTLARHQAFPSAVIFIAASIWGLYWLPLRTLEGGGITGGWAVALFNSMPLMVLVPWVVLAGQQGRSGLRTAMLVGLLTGTGMGLYAMGLVHSSVVRATLLFYLTPVWSTMIGAWWLGERVDWRRWAAIGIGLTGLVLLLSGGSPASVPINIGDLFGLLSGIVWAFGIATIKRWPEVPVVSMTLFQFLFAALSSGLTALVMLGLPTASGRALAEGVAFAGVASVGFIMPSVLAIFWASKRVFPGRAGLLMMSEVLVAVLSAWWLLPDERMASLEWLGATFVVGACLLEVMGTRRAERKVAG